TSPASSVCWLAARWPSAKATFHLLADNSSAMYSISTTLVSLIRACLVVPISVLLGRLVGMDFLPQDARLGEPFIASPLEGEGTSFDPFQTHASRLTPHALRLTLHASQKTFPPLQGLQGE